jgi:hypothetical protein
MHQFDSYAPLSWVLAGFAGVTFVVLANLGWQWAKRIGVRAKYDARLLASGSVINPLDKTFEGKRIYINDFTLPSHALIDGKTFIDCEIVGPANLFWQPGNIANEIKPPRCDAVYLEPGVQFFNGYTLRNCIFRGCSFQRITLFIGTADYENVKNHELLNWITMRPGGQGELSLLEDQSRVSDSQSVEDTEEEEPQ